MSDTEMIDRPTPGTDIAILGPVTAVTVFGTEGGVDAILEKIRAQARAVETDISTPAGRQAVASLAYKIARSKTALDGMGKELGEANYRAWKAITAERGRIETELDALRDEVRRPLTQWENAEKARVAAHEAAIDALVEGPQFYTADNPSEDLAARLRYLESLPERDWQEFAKRAADALANEIVKTKVALVEAVRREAAAEAAAKAAREEAEAAAAREAERQRQRVLAAAAQARQEAEERARIAAEEAARQAEAEKQAAVEKVEREKREAAAEAKAAAEALATRIELARQAAEKKIRDDAAARAKLDADHLAAVERQTQEASERADRAEAARLAATAKARADMERQAADAEVARKAAVEKAAADERQRIEAAQAKDAAEAAAREANRRHRAQIHGEARDALVKEGLSEPAATSAITAIARGAVPHVRVSY